MAAARMHAEEEALYNGPAAGAYEQAWLLTGSNPCAEEGAGSAVADTGGLTRPLPSRPLTRPTGSQIELIQAARADGDGGRAGSEPDLQLGSSPCDGHTRSRDVDYLIIGNEREASPSSSGAWASGSSSRSIPRSLSAASSTNTSLKSSATARVSKSPRVQWL